MKLSPPASSSDLDAAREVARRLNLIAMPAEPTRPLPDYAPLKGAREASPPPPRRPAPPAWEKAAPPPASPIAAAPPLPPPIPRAQDPVVHESGPVEAPPPSPELREARPPLAVEPPPPSPATSEVEAAPAAPAPPEPPRPVAVEPPAAPVEEVQEIEEDLEPDEPAASIEAAVAAPLTWAEVVANCLELAEAKGALLINPDGRVAAVSGDWPSPGAEAIAARLVPAMDKALKDAPTRSVSVPLGGLHLTAWRAPMTQGLVTVGFVAEAPLRPDLRPAIDATLKKGPEA